MAESLQKFSTTLGYPEPRMFFNQMLFLSGSGAVATALAKVFLPTINSKTHFTFGQVTLLTFGLLFNNQRIVETIKGNNNPIKQRLLLCGWFLSYATIPWIFSQVVVSRMGESLTFSGSFRRGLYYGGVATFSFYTYVRHQQDQRRRGS